MHEHASNQHLMLPLHSHHLPRRVVWSSPFCQEIWSRHTFSIFALLLPCPVFLHACHPAERRIITGCWARRSRSLLKPLTNKNMNHGILGNLNWSNYSGGGAGRLASVGYTNWVSPVLGHNFPSPPFPSYLEIPEAGPLTSTR
jgi:hypothetical protein